MIRIIFSSFRNLKTRSFVKGIQKNGAAIAQELEECADIKDTLLDRIIDYEVTTYREKQKQSAIKDKSESKKKLLEEYIKEAEQNRKRIESLIRDGKIIMEQLPPIDAQTRTVLLSWISGAKNRENKDGYFRTEYGWEFKLIEPEDNRKFTLKCDDGDTALFAESADNDVLYESTAFTAVCFVIQDYLRQKIIKNVSQKKIRYKAFRLYIGFCIPYKIT